MKLIVSGKTKDFTPDLEEKFSAKISKLSKFIERRGEREAHVTHHMERHLHKVEVVVNFHDHALVGEGLDADLDAALCHAVEKLEKQIVKVLNKFRDTHRDPKAVRTLKENAGATDSGSRPPAALNGKSHNGTHNGTQHANQHAHPKVFRVNYTENRKPMTLEEAILEIQADSDDYVVYRDFARDCLSVLVRRPDGNFDLIES